MHPVSAAFGPKTGDRSLGLTFSKSERPLGHLWSKTADLQPYGNHRFRIIASVFVGGTLRLLAKTPKSTLVLQVTMIHERVDTSASAKHGFGDRCAREKVCYFRIYATYSIPIIYLGPRCARNLLNQLRQSTDRAALVLVAKTCLGLQRRRHAQGAAQTHRGSIILLILDFFDIEYFKGRSDY
jgi:hypothetical protein